MPSWRWRQRQLRNKATSAWMAKVANTEVEAEMARKEVAEAEAKTAEAARKEVEATAVNSAIVGGGGEGTGSRETDEGIERGKLCLATCYETYELVDMGD